MTAPTPGLPDTCPRCGGAFLCGASGPGPCACAGLTLTPAMLADLKARYTHCLCVACLAQIAAGDCVESTALHAPDDKRAPSAHD